MEAAGASGGRATSVLQPSRQAFEELPPQEAPPQASEEPSPQESQELEEEASGAHIDRFIVSVLQARGPRARGLP